MRTIDIAVFARAPQAGAAKTRLIPRLGAEGAARLQAWLTVHALERAQALPGARLSLWTAGAPDHEFWRQCERRFALRLRTQPEGDLGARMAAAFASTLAEGASPMLLIGTDCPAQTTAELAQAVLSLDAADAVIQPAADGGYVLIGMKRPSPALFADIDWGSAQVAEQTRARARSAEITLAELAPRPDLDTPADLDLALACGWVPATAWDAS